MFARSTFVKRSAKWLRIVLALAVFIGIGYAFLCRIPAVQTINDSVTPDGAAGASKSFELASFQFVPALDSVISTMGSPAFLIPVCTLAALVVLTLLFGRLYCSIICPLGILQDVAYRIRKWIRPKKFLKYHAAVPYVRYAVLGVLALLCVCGLSGFALNWLDPYSIYGRAAYNIAQPLAALINNGIDPSGSDPRFYNIAVHTPTLWAGIVAFAVTGIILVLAIWRGRIYCNSICPVGSLLGLLSRFSLFRLGIDTDTCVRCGHCLKTCKAQCLDIKEHVIDTDRCINCFNCVTECDEGAISYRLFSKCRHHGDPEPAYHPKKQVATPEADKPAETPAPAPADTQSAASQSAIVPGGRLDRRQFIAGTGAGLMAMLLSGCNGSKAAPGDPDKCALPPGAGSLDRFLSVCTGCQLCIASCPTHVLQPAGLELGLAGFMKPRMDYRTKYCLYDCHKCAEVCPTGAIQRLPITCKEDNPTQVTKDTTRIALATFYSCRCLVRRNGEDCGACTEHCPTKALYTVEHKMPDGKIVRLPELDPTLCIGCGACEYACPVTQEPESEDREHAKCWHDCKIHDTCPFRKERKARKNKQKPFPNRAIMIRAVNPQEHAVRKFEAPAVDPLGNKDFPF